MALIDAIESFGSRVDAGDIGREEAARRLAEASNGGLTVLGATQLIDTWQGVRARLLKGLAETEAELRRMGGEPR